MKPRVFPLVRHGDHIGVEHVGPGAVPRRRAARRGKRLDAVLAEPAVRVQVVAFRQGASPRPFAARRLRSSPRGSFRFAWWLRIAASGADVFRQPFRSRCRRGRGRAAVDFEGTPRAARHRPPRVYTGRIYPRIDRMRRRRCSTYARTWRRSEISDHRSTTERVHMHGCLFPMEVRYRRATPRCPAGVACRGLNCFPRRNLGRKRARTARPLAGPALFCRLAGGGLFTLMSAPSYHVAFTAAHARRVTL